MLERGEEEKKKKKNDDIPRGEKSFFEEENEVKVIQRHTNITDGGEMCANVLELAGGCGDGDLVLSVWDTQLLDIDVHELQLEL